MCFSSETIYDGISSAFKFQADSFVKLHFVIVMGAFMKDIHTSGHLNFYFFAYIENCGCFLDCNHLWQSLNYTLNIWPDFMKKKKAV